MANAKLLIELARKLAGTSDNIPLNATKPALKPGERPVGPGPGVIDSAETLEEKGFNQFQRELIEGGETDPKVPHTRDTLPEVFPGEETRLPSSADDKTNFDAIFRGSEDVDAPQNRVHRQQVDPSRPVGEQVNIGDVQLRKEQEIITEGQALLKQLHNSPPEEQQKAIREMVIRKLMGIEVDENAKKTFDLLENVEAPLKTSLPENSTQAQRRALGDSKQKLGNFRREAAQGAAEARRTNDPALLQALQDRLTGPPKGRPAVPPGRQVPVEDAMITILKDILSEGK